MKKFQVFGVRTKEETQREIKHKLLAREAASEGMVLLKNDGILPLKPQRIGLFGGGSRMTVKGGSGSGEVNERHSVSIEEGLKSAGFTFETLYMDRYEKKFNDDIKAWRDEVDKAIEKFNLFTTMKMFNEINNHPKPLPCCTKVLEDEIDKDVDVAIYVLSRQAGEGHDRKYEKGDYLLSDIEIESLKLISSHYKKLILIINSGGPVDLTVLDEVNINALIYIGQPGMEGGNAFADILTGNVNPSGKLTDTWAYKYEDYPSYNTYSHMNGNLDEEEYYEGIYVGYRYFSTFNKKPRFPFGFGLSYTSFETKFLEGNINKETVDLTFSIKNIGNKFKGKEVVQVYVRKPSTKIDCEKFSLASFNKTKLLDVGETQILRLDFNIQSLAIFDSKTHQFMVQEGEYGVYYGNNVEELRPALVIIVKKDIVLEKVLQILDKKLTFEDLTSDREPASYDANLPRLVLDDRSVKTKTHTVYEQAFNTKVKSILSKLKKKEKIMLVVGGGYKLKSYNAVMGAAGRTNTELLSKGIPNIILSDGPAGINVTQATVILKNGAPRFPEDVPEMWKWGWLRKFSFVAKAKPGKGTPSYRFMTAWPSETVQAQTWNTELLKEIGKAIGVEMIESGVSVWLAPGMNIHRNPLCGRNFEYYSEDPLISGKMAASITKGVQSIGGVGVSIKHFCCNNQEDNRYAVSENVSQRALREIYLRGFRIAIEEGKPWTVMSCYNKVDGTYVCNSRELLTNVLRNEWNYDGLVMSDWSAVDKASYAEAINAGNDLIMPGNEQIVKKLKKQDKNGELEEDKLNISTLRVLDLIFKSAVNKDFKK